MGERERGKREGERERVGESGREMERVGERRREWEREGESRREKERVRETRSGETFTIIFIAYVTVQCTLFNCDKRLLIKVTLDITSFIVSMSHVTLHTSVLVLVLLGQGVGGGGREGEDAIILPK